MAKKSKDPNKIVLAYSGGLDTSVILRWLIENYGAEVVCFCGDIGQKEDVDAVVEKALATGAKDCIVSDLRDEFAGEFCFPAIQANAIYEGRYLLGTSLARPVLAREQVRVAKRVGADTVSRQHCDSPDPAHAPAVPAGSTRVVSTQQRCRSSKARISSRCSSR